MFLFERAVGMQPGTGVVRLMQQRHEGPIR
ncbi:MAG: hypothetical protein PWP08_133 [Methanofollis sp.]|nr:hypothetical protein [Methanofollis sp.]